jgi:hypothetical protein
MKKIISMFILIFILCNSISYAKDNNNEKTNEKDKAVETLIKLGWTKDDIYNMLPDKEILEYADIDLNKMQSCEKYYKVVVTKNLERSGEQTTAKTIEISKEDCLAEIERNKNKLTTRSTHKAESNGYYKLDLWLYPSKDDDYMISGKFTWLTQPVHTHTDVFGIGNGVHLTSIENPEPYFVYKVDKYEYNEMTGHKKYIKTLTYEKDAKQTEGSVFAKFDLKNKISGSYGYFNHKGYMKYYATINNSNATCVSANCNYAHHYKTYHVTPTISYPWGGSLTVTPSSHYSKLDKEPYCCIKLKK